MLGEDGELRFILGTARDVGEREELRSRLRDLDAVYRFADAVAGASELGEVLEVALDALLEATGADRASVLLSDDENVMRFRAWRGLSDEYRAATDGHSAWAPDETDPQPVLVEDAAAAGFEPWLEEIVRNEGIAALAFIPLVRRGRLLGKFMLYRNAPHAWSDREILLARTIANHLASVTERHAGAGGAPRVARAARDDPPHRRRGHHGRRHDRAPPLRERRLGAAVREGVRRGASRRAA